MNISKLFSLISKTLFIILFISTFIYCDNKNDEPKHKIDPEANINFSLNGKKINKGEEISAGKEFIEDISQMESEYISIDADANIDLNEYTVVLTKLDHKDDKDIGLVSFCYKLCYETKNLETYTYNFEKAKFDKEETLHISYLFSETSKKGDYKVRLSLLKGDKELTNFIMVFTLNEDLKPKQNNEEKEEKGNISFRIDTKNNDTNQNMEVEQGSTNNNIVISIENLSNISYEGKLSLLSKKQNKNDLASLASIYNAKDEDDFIELASIENTKIEAGQKVNLNFNADFSKLEAGTYKLYIRYYSSDNGAEIPFELETMNLTIKEKKTPIPTPPSPPSPKPTPIPPTPKPEPIVVSLETKEIKEFSFEKATVTFDFAIKNISEKDYNGSLEIFAIKENTNNKINLYSIQSTQISKKSTKDFSLNIDISKLEVSKYSLYFTYKKQNNGNIEPFDVRFANLVIREKVQPKPIDSDNSEETTEEKETNIILSSYTGQYCSNCSRKIKNGVWDKLKYDRYKDRVIKVSLHSIARQTGFLYDREADEYDDFTAPSVKVTGLPTVIVNNKRPVFPSEYELDENLAIESGLNSKLEAKLTGNKLEYSFVTKKIKNKTFKHNKENLNVIFWLLESDIIAPQTYFGSDYQHDNVFIGTLDGKLWGRKIKLGEKYTASKADISKMFKAGGKKLSVVAIVMDGNNKEFIDAVKVDIK